MDRDRSRRASLQVVRCCGWTLKRPNRTGPRAAPVEQPHQQKEP